MGTIAKSYTTVIVDGVVANASSVRRALDDAYDVINGGLDSANLSATFKSNWFAASQISINDTAGSWSATTVEELAIEINTNFNNACSVTIQDFTVIGNLGSASQQYAGHTLEVTEPGTSSCEVLALYLFQSASMTADEKGDFTLTNVCEVANVAGLFGADYAASFNGVNQYFTQDTLLDAAVTNGIAIDFWFNADDGRPGSIQYLMNKDNVTNEDRFSVYLDTAGIVRCEAEANNAGSDTIKSTTVFSSGSTGWNHVCCNWDSTNGLRLWINGVLEAINTTSTSVMISGNSQAFIIGALYTPGNYFDGKIANFRVRDKVLIQRDVDIAFATKYNLPSAVQNLEYDISAYVRDGGSSEFEKPFDYNNIEIARNSASFYRLGGFLTGLSAADSLKLIARKK